MRGGAKQRRACAARSQVRGEHVSAGRLRVWGDVFELTVMVFARVLMSVEIWHRDGKGKVHCEWIVVNTHARHGLDVHK